MSQVRNSIHARSLVRAIVIAARVVAAGLAVAGASTDVALAQASYPSKPVRIVVGFAAADRPTSSPVCSEPSSPTSSVSRS
jgi:hypothetical protein